MLRIVQSGKPHHFIDSISFNGKSWELHKTTGHTDIYDRIQIRLDAGFFMMLTFYPAKLAMENPNRSCQGAENLTRFRLLTRAARTPAIVTRYLTLYKNNQKENIIVFYDQITKDECRHFYLVEKLVQNL